jgi:hypothetical protein
MIETRDKILLKKIIAVMSNKAPYTKRFISTLATILTIGESEVTKEELLHVYDTCEKIMEKTLINIRMRKGVVLPEINRCLTRMANKFLFMNTNIVNYLDTRLHIMNSQSSE